MNVDVYNHRDGNAIIPAKTIESIQSVLALERPRKPLSASKIRKNILEKLHRIGWSSPVRLDPESGMTVPSVKDSVALCFQSGNMARFYADLLKLQLLYTRKKVVGAVFLIYTKRFAQRLGDNIAHYERLTKELALFQNIITIPAIVMGLEGDD